MFVSRIEKARQLIKQHKLATENIYHGDVFFSDTGEVLLMSKQAGTTTPIAGGNKSTAAVSEVATLEDLEIDKPAPVPANGTAVQPILNSSTARVFGFIHSHTGGYASKKEYYRVTGYETIGHLTWNYFDKDTKAIIRIHYGGKLEEIEYCVD